MKTVILGAGAMGSVIGGTLARAGNDVVLIEVDKEIVCAIEKRGLLIEDRTGQRTAVKLKATHDLSEVGLADLIIVFVKCYHTEAAVRQAAALMGPNTIVLSLQNGWGNAALISKLIGPERVLVGVSYHSAVLLAPGHVLHAGHGPTFIGELDGTIMRLYTFTTDGQQHLGAEKLLSGDLVHLHAVDPAIPDSLLEFIRGGEGAVRLAHQVLTTNPPSCYRLAEIALEAPLPRPGKILCSGINYRSHQQENPNATMPEEPFFFAKMPSAVIGPGAPILHPPRAGQVDYEIEFAVVIGRPMSSTAETEVMSHLFGYTILHDVSCREVQFKNHQVTLGKNFDSFCPIGPCVVTVDELVAPDRVGLRTYLNGELMQDGSTADWIFRLPKLLSFLSQVMTLEPGDIVSTGTPSGVGLFRNPPRFLKPGDKVRLEADGIGTLENPVRRREVSVGNASPP